MPARYRDAIAAENAGQVVVTVDHTDRCLLIYPLNEWLKVEQTLMSLPNMNRRVRNMQRLILGHASEHELDAQGRMLLPAPLREYAGLGKKAVLVGQMNKFELWDADAWFSARDAWVEEAQDDDGDDDVLNQVSM
jgi:MraZ protein